MFCGKCVWKNKNPIKVNSKPVRYHILASIHSQIYTIICSILSSTDKSYVLIMFFLIQYIDSRSSRLRQSGKMNWTSWGWHKTM